MPFKLEVMPIKTKLLFTKVQPARAYAYKLVSILISEMYLSQFEKTMLNNVSRKLSMMNFTFQTDTKKQISFNAERKALNKNS